MKVKKIKTLEDINNIRVGDIVRLSGYGRMIYNGETERSHSFIGRCKSRIEITEVIAYKIRPEGNPDGIGNILVDVPYNESTYRRCSIVSGDLYKNMNKKLRRAGI